LKRFDFPLDKVRRWRRDQAELEEIQLQKLFSELRAIESERQQMQAEGDTATIEIRSLPDALPQDYVNLESFHHYVRGRLLQIEEKRRLHQVKVEEQRRTLLDAQRQFELLESLRRKALVTWKAEEAKEQEDLAAELYLAKRLRENRF
jgi:flagellar export protein FliJ